MTTSPLRRAARVLVTGAQGFIGRHVVADWLDADPDVALVGVGRSPRADDHFTHDITWGGRRRPAPLPARLAAAARDPRYQYVAADLTQAAALTELLGELRPDVVVHLAASLRDEPPEQLVRSNVGAVVALLDAVVGSGIDPPRVVLGSSGSVYGVVPGRELPLAEEMPCAPVDPYSVSKRAAEDMARILADEHGLAVVIARIFNPVGAGQDERHLCGRLGQQVAEIASGLTQPTITVGALHTTRDYVDVRDVATALRLVAVRGEDGGTYNVASGVETAGEQVLDTLLEQAGIRERVEVVRGPGRRADMERHVADVTRLRALGWTSRHGLTESLSTVLDYYAHTVSAAGPHRGSVEVRPIVLAPDRSHRCTVEVRPGLLDDLPVVLAARHPGVQMVVLTDTGVHDLYAAPLAARLAEAGVPTDTVVVPEGETSKSLATFSDVVRQLHERRVDRRAVLVCVGGGMVTDLGGYVAASYLRGLRYVNVPTTLLAQHDSAIGGKVAVNMPWAKNFVGAFHHPTAVHCDPLVLSTLDDRNLRCGVAEAIKVALCGAPGLFELLERAHDAVMARDPEVLGDLVRRAAEHKVALLAPDPYEIDLRRALNLGHTFGHLLEVELGYGSILHGEAVALGLCVATVVGRDRELVAPGDAQRIFDLVRTYRIVPPVSLERLQAAAGLLDEVRLVRAGPLNFVVPNGLCSVEILPELEAHELDRAIDQLAGLPAWQDLIRS